MARVAMVSDVHANYHALCAVMDDAFKKVVCHGDVVGYNANPVECLDYFMRHQVPVVRGRREELLLNEDFRNVKDLYVPSMELKRLYLSYGNERSASFPISHSSLAKSEALTSCLGPCEARKRRSNRYSVS